MWPSGRGVPILNGTESVFLSARGGRPGVPVGLDYSPALYILLGQGTAKVRFDASDRAFLAALLNRLPRAVLRRVRLLVRLDTVLRWHSVIVRPAWTEPSQNCCPPSPGCPAPETPR